MKRGPKEGHARPPAVGQAGESKARRRAQTVDPPPTPLPAGLQAGLVPGADEKPPAPDAKAAAAAEKKVDDTQASLDLLERIREQGRRVTLLQMQWDSLHEAAGDAKKELEAADIVLHDLIDASRTPLPLFDAAGDKPPTPSGPPSLDIAQVVENALNAAAKNPQTAGLVGQAFAHIVLDAWKPIRLDSLADPAIPPGILRRLADGAGIETLGELATRTGGDEHLDVRGIGPAALDKIAAATDGFWKRWHGPPATPEGGDDIPPDMPPDPGKGLGDLPEADEDILEAALAGDAEALGENASREP